jgi:D-sedoheptulose 7-phosphate isomerase
MLSHFEKSLDALYVAVHDHDFCVRVRETAMVCTRVLSRGGKIFLCGNGGSAADAQHLAAEFVGRYDIDRGPLAAIALTTDTSALTAIANDFGFEEIFARQVEALGQKGDILLAFSTSGRSLNIIKAIRRAHRMEMMTVTFTGKNGIMGGLPDIEVRAPSVVTPIIQQLHMVAGHTICEMVGQALNYKGAD